VTCLPPACGIGRQGGEAGLTDNDECAEKPHWIVEIQCGLIYLTDYYVQHAKFWRGMEGEVGVAIIITY
jgi:hypothetical protein